MDGFLEPSCRRRVNGAIGDDLVGVMLVCVPLPVCQMRNGTDRSTFPAMTSSAACAISRRFVGGEFASSWFHERGGLLEDAQRANQLGGIVFGPMLK